jgi:alanine racemase
VCVVCRHLLRLTRASTLVGCADMLSGMAQALVNLSTLTHNVSVIRSHLQPPTNILVAIKANAYGHGAARVGQHLESLGVKWFGVATAIS